MKQLLNNDQKKKNSGSHKLGAEAAEHSSHLLVTFKHALFIRKEMHVVCEVSTDKGFWIILTPKTHIFISMENFLIWHFDQGIEVF